MLKFIVVLAAAMVVLAATDDAQSRGLRRSRGSCPNGQCPVSLPAAATETATTSDGAEAVVAADVTTATDAVRTSYRRTRGIRLFRRR
jgi:phosphoenolpyruvate-protein kinase (PTS system EI component)